MKLRLHRKGTKIKQTEMELIIRIQAYEIARNTTPYGDECIRANGPLHDLIWQQARDDYQRDVARNLAYNGYVIGYLADGGALKGNALRYKGRYEQSLHNFAERVENALPGRYHLVYDQVGPKGAWGYRLTDETC